MYNLRVPYTLDVESPWEMYNQRGAYTSHVESLWIGPEGSNPEENGVEEFQVNGGKWGISGTLGTPGGTVSWSLPTAGLTNQTGQTFFTGSTVAFSSIVTFNFQTVIQSVFDAWSAVADISFTQIADGGGNIGIGTSAHIRIVAGFIDGDPPGGNVLARAFLPNSGSGTSSQGAANGDVVMDSGQNWTQNLFFLTMLHEVGHSLGLSHSSATAIMSPTINTSLTGLTADDIAGIQSIYGAVGAPPADDYAANTGTTGAVVPGGSAGGDIEISGDQDWFRISLTAGTEYEFRLQGSPSAMGTLADPTLSLRNSVGTQIAFDDDGGTGLESLITFTATTSGTFYLDAGGFSTNTGTYVVSATVLSTSDDFGQTPGTAGTVSVGGNTTGNVEVANDLDWLGVFLTGGQAYVIDLEGFDTGQGNLSNPFLRLHNSSGTQVAFDDDGGVGFNSQLTFTPTSSGTFYVSAGGTGSSIGGYMASVAIAPSTDDFAGDITTTGTISAGQSRTGTIETNGDADWFKITLTAGVDYQFDLEGSPTGQGTLSDTYLRLHDASGTQITFNDDGGTGLNSQITLTATSSGTFYLLAEAFSTNTGSYTLSATGAPAPHDFDGDGRSDLFWQNDNGQGAIWQMNGTTTIGGGLAGNNPGPTWNFRHTGDFNNDGRSDIVWQNDNGQAAIWLMNSTTVIGGGLAGTNPGPTWQIGGTGDFNNDGNSDLVWQNDNGQAAIWFMNGNTVIGGGLAGNNPGPTWQIRGTGDFNNDGNSDLVWQNDSGQAAIWLMNGTTVIGGGLAGGNPGPTWQIQSTADFNNDGNSDLVWQNDSGQAAIWFMNGNTVIGGGLAGGNPGSTWHLRDTGDYNADGKFDFVWQNDSGQAAIWLMDGTTTIGGGLAGSNPGPDWMLFT